MEFRFKLSAMDVPYARVTLLLYEEQQAMTKRKRPTRAAHPDLTTPPAKATDFLLVGGNIAGGMGSWVANPFDVIRTRI
jgi:hypothetical protein